LIASTTAEAVSEVEVRDHVELDDLAQPLQVS